MDSPGSAIFLASSIFLAGCSLFGIKVPIPKSLRANFEDEKTEDNNGKEIVEKDEDYDQKIENQIQIVKTAMADLCNLLAKNSRISSDENSLVLTEEQVSFKKAPILRPRTLNLLSRLNQDLSKKKVQLNDIIRAVRLRKQQIEMGLDQDYESGILSEEEQLEFFDACEIPHSHLKPGQFLISSASASDYQLAFDKLLKLNQGKNIYVDTANEKFREVQPSEEDLSRYLTLTSGNEIDFLIKTGIFSEIIKISAESSNLIDVVINFFKEFCICVLKAEGSSEKEFVEEFDAVIALASEPSNRMEIKLRIEEVNLDPSSIFKNFVKIYSYDYDQIISLLPVSVSGVRSSFHYVPITVAFKTISTALGYAIESYDTSNSSPEKKKLVGICKIVAPYLALGFLNTYCKSHRFFLKLLDEIKAFIKDLYDSKAITFESQEKLVEEINAQVSAHLNEVLDFLHKST